MKATLITGAMQTLTITESVRIQILQTTNYLKIPKVNGGSTEKLMTTGIRFYKDQMAKMYSPIQEPSNDGPPRRVAKPKFPFFLIPQIKSF